MNTTLALIALVLPAQLDSSPLEPVWAAAALECPAATLTRAAADLPRPADVAADFLLREVHVSFDSSGRRKQTERWLYRILDQNAVQQLGVFQTEWSPWFQDRPQVRGRVITRDGREHSIRSRDIAEGPVPGAQPNLLTDRRQLQVPLPALASGAVVEIETQTTDRHVPFEAGYQTLLPLSTDQTLYRFRATVEFPNSLPLKHVVRGTTVVPDVTREDGSTRLVIDLKGDQVKPPDWEFFASRDAQVRPQLLLGTGDSWEAVAAAYAQMVADRMEMQAVADAMPAALIKAGGSRLERIQAVLAWQQSQIRYTGIEFGSSSLIPASSSECLQRRYGDCKDQSALLVAALSQLGIEAHVALVSAGSDTQIERGAPAINAFDHAIVHVPGAEPLWIDPTAAGVAAAQIPAGVEGRLALIASPRSGRLEMIPHSRSRDNSMRVSLDIRFPQDGAAQVTRATSVTGALAANYRGYYSQFDQAAIEQQWNQSARQNWSAAGIDSLKLENLPASTRPFELNVELRDVWGMGSLSDGYGSASLSLGEFLDRIPYLLRIQRFAGSQEGSGVSRRHPVQLPFAFQVDITVKVQVPPGFEVLGDPDLQSWSVGDTSFQYSRKQLASGEMEWFCAFDSGDDPWTPAEWNEIEQKLFEFSQVASSQLVLQLTADRLFEEGELGQALAELSELSRGQTADAWYQARFGALLVEAGLGESARQQVDEAVRRQPGRAILHRYRAAVYGRGLLGEQVSSGKDLQQARASLEKAVQLDPDDANSRLELAVIHEYDDFGSRYSPDANLAESLKHYAELLREEPEEPDEAYAQIRLNAAVAHLFHDQFREAREHAEQLPQQLQAVQLKMTAVQCLEGTAAVLQAAGEYRDPQQRAMILAGASDYLSYLRRYEPALQLIDEAIKLLGPQAPENWRRSQAALKVIDGRLYQSPENVFAEPDGLVRELVSRVVRFGYKPEVWEELFAEPLGMSEEDRYVTVRALTQNTLPVRLQSEQMAMSYPVWARDLAVLNQLEVEGDDQLGYRIEDNSNRRRLVWYAVPTENGLRLREAGTENVELGLDALQLLAADRVPAARRRLEWAAQGTNASLFNPFGQSPFVQLWFLIRDRDDKRLLELAAATLAARTAETLDNRVLQVLSQPIDDLLEAQKIQIHRARLQAFRGSKRFDSYLKGAEQLADKYSIVPSVTVARIDALLSLERFEQADQLIQEQLERRDGESSLHYCRLSSAAAQGDPDAVKYSRKVRDRFEKDGYLLGLSALLELEQGDSQAAFNLAQRAMPMMIFREPRILRLMALCEAANGQPAQALERLRILHQTEGPSEDKRLDAVVLGRIAEHYGVRDMAAEFYRSASGLDPREGLALSLYPRLAQQWLARVSGSESD